ncbi:VOC family protein [Hoeflea sp.]|uniref:VOC family protein n=1 Tax=Hoeflea sp. TaxID=1940281 RepID=UPI003747C66C
MTTELNMMIDHVSLSVADMGRAKGFYTAIFATLGMELVADVTAQQSGSVAYAGFGIGRKGQLWIGEDGQQTPSTHICFRAATRQAVRDFHAAGLANGGTDNGAPGIREIYHPEYYAAFITDPEGHNIEAVCFEPEDGQ